MNFEEIFTDAKELAKAKGLEEEPSLKSILFLNTHDAGNNPRGTAIQEAMADIAKKNGLDRAYVFECELKANISHEAVLASQTYTVARDGKVNRRDPRTNNAQLAYAGFDLYHGHIATATLAKTEIKRKRYVVYLGRCKVVSTSTRNVHFFGFHENSGDKDNPKDLAEIATRLSTSCTSGDCFVLLGDMNCEPADTQDALKDSKLSDKVSCFAPDRATFGDSNLDWALGSTELDVNVTTQELSPESSSSSSSSSSSMVSASSSSSSAVSSASTSTASTASSTVSPRPLSDHRPILVQTGLKKESKHRDTR